MNPLLHMWALSYPWNTRTLCEIYELYVKYMNFPASHSQWVTTLRHRLCLLNPQACGFGHSQIDRPLLLFWEKTIPNSSLFLCDSFTFSVALKLPPCNLFDAYLGLIFGVVKLIMIYDSFCFHDVYVIIMHILNLCSAVYLLYWNTTRRKNKTWSYSFWKVEESAKWSLIYCNLSTNLQCFY